MREVSLLEMLEAGVHFGHQVSRWHPKMKPYIFTARNGIHIINLEKTAVKLKEALEFVKNLAAREGIILFVGTKRQAREIVKKYAQNCGMPYLVERWLGGMFTNFDSISKLIKKYKDLKAKESSGELERYTKKERLSFQKKIERLKEIIGGVEQLSELPQAIFIVDTKEERTAVREARKTKIPIVALADTNVNPKEIDYFIPSNDDATKAIELMTSLIAEAVNEGKGLKEIKAKQEDSNKKEI